MYKLFFDYWKTIEFSTWNESDIREEFIAPLLKILGYGSGTINNIIREKSLKLNSPYHRVGRKRVQIDYIPTIRLKSFWIIEAKPGNKKEMDMGDLLQAHLYAIHPEIQARFIVLINGWEIRIFDSFKVSNWDDYIISCSQQSSFDDFMKFVEILNSKDMLRFLRQQIMQQIENSFEVELDKAELQLFYSSLQRKEYDLQKQIQNNAKEYRNAAWKRRTEKYQQELQKLPLDLLLVRMDIPVDRSFETSIEYARRIIESDNNERINLIDKLAMNWRSGKHAIFKVHSLDVLIRLLSEGIDIKPSSYQHGIIESINELALLNINYGLPDPRRNALCHLDNISTRLGYKIAHKLGMEYLTEIVANEKLSLSIEDQLTKEPTVAKKMLSLVNRSCENLWRLFSRNDTQTIWNGIWSLQYFEGIIDQLPLKNYPDGDQDLLFFESYGKGIDMLIMGTWDILNSNLNLIETTEGISSEVLEFSRLSRDNSMIKIPNPISPPPDWQFNSESITL
ncbi:type I restriction enzyme HsdR N-terminal domain-containing protein [Paenibacillus xylanilyticus]|uniref:Type I restriction enzyme R protein N-terminal domain-containing protein n=1 Tax=Paenibacillus xylanilyticus TaxID=248903 RepID=A0A7Y6EWV1_9BACL|nr:type I restriction enzyme HsdR N-terminal domain-containing protein [Paenibacillus xylanilyticus]NUU78176.1 hypothetical protein [Paenibacillus xylanilyticus]